MTSLSTRFPTKATSQPDSIIRSCPGVERAVQETVDALTRQGHECVEIQVPDFLEAMRVFVALTSADKYETLTSHIGPDPKDPSLFLVTLGSKLPGKPHLGMW